MVSFRRRALPASWTRSTPGNALILCSNAVPYFNPISKRRRARKRERSSIPSSMRCSDFLPNPFIGAMRPCSAASLSAAMESTPNSSCINLIRFGPSPGIPSISIIPCGVSSCKRTQSSGQTPSKIAWERAEPRPLPIPFISNKRPVTTNSCKSSVIVPIIRLPF